MGKRTGPGRPRTPRASSRYSPIRGKLRTKYKETMIKVGIIGGSGYTGGELIRLLLRHPEVEIDFVFSTTRATKAISTAHPDQLGHVDMKAAGEGNPGVDVVYLCADHRNSNRYVEEHPFSPGTGVIDLGNDFRLEADANFEDRPYVDGL